MRKEHSRLQAEQAANIAAAEKKAAALAREEAAPGIPLGFNPIRYSSPCLLWISPYELTEISQDALYNAHLGPSGLPPQPHASRHKFFAPP